MKIQGRSRVTPIHLVAGDSLKIDITPPSGIKTEVCTMVLAEPATIEEIIVFEGDPKLTPPWVACDTVFAAYETPRKKRIRRTYKK